MAVAERAQVINVQLPRLHAGQVDIEAHPARFKVVVCGRRWGKTTYGVWKTVKGALELPGVYWWVAPTYKVINNSNAWGMLKALTGSIPGCEVREGDGCVRFSNGSEIWIKSADNPDGLRGPKLRGVILDEFAQIRPDTWFEVIRPALTDYKGWALFIGTPKGKNWAYRLFEMAKVRDNWESWRKPTVTNPFIDPAEVEDARNDMTEEGFAQEYLADFGASQYLVYPEVDPDIHEWRDPIPEFISYHGGLDFGGDTIGAHKSTGAIAGRTRADELIIFTAFEQSGPNIAERQLNWILEQEASIRELRIRMKQRDVGNPIYRADKSQSLGIQFLSRFGLNVFPTKGGPDSVLDGIELMHRRLQPRLDPTTGKKKPRLYWLKGSEGSHWVRDGLMRYRWPEPKPDDKVQSKNPLKVNDDMVDAIRYLVEGVDRNIVGNPQQLYEGLIPRMIQ